MTTTSTTTMRLDLETLRLLEALARVYGISRTDVVRRAVRELAAREGYTVRSKREDEEGKR